MNESNNKYHRTGEPGGSGCKLSALSIQIKDDNGELQNGQLLCAEKEATELELLRTVAQRLGVKWGHDDLGWWAAVIDTANTHK